MIEHLRKKLIFRSWHRGTREMDLMMGRFADTKLHEYDVAKLESYEQLMHENDPDIYNWITGADTLPDHIKTNVALIELIQFYNAR